MTRNREEIYYLIDRYGNRVEFQDKVLRNQITEYQEEAADLRSRYEVILTKAEEAEESAQNAADSETAAGNSAQAAAESAEDAAETAQDLSDLMTSYTAHVQAQDQAIADNNTAQLAVIDQQTTSKVAAQVAAMQVIEGQTVIDSTLTVSGAAAEAEKVGTEITELKNDLDFYRDEFGASIQYADATAFKDGYRYNLSSSNVLSEVSDTGYATLAIMDLPAGTYYFNYTYDAFCIIEKISDGTYEKFQTRTGSSNTAISGGRSTTIDYDFNMYITRRKTWTSSTLWCNNALPSTYVLGIYRLPFLDYTMQTKAVAVTSGNYASVLPDLNDAEKNRIYVMVFANGSTSIPANYPFASWKGTTATLITFGTANRAEITQMLFLDGYIFTRRKSSATTWNGWYTPTNKIFTVDANGNGDYTSLSACCADAINYANAKIYVNAGTYDLIEEFGADYFANLGSADDRAGIQLGNGMHIIFSSQAKVVCHYTGDNTNVDRYFSPFNSRNGSFVLENADIDASRCRYCVHDEHTSNQNLYKSIYKNCRMKIDNSGSSVWTNAQCIGGGLGTNGEIIVEDSYFYGEGSTRNQGVVSYHNTSVAGARSRIVVKGCYFDGTDSTVRFGYYGQSEEMTDCIIHDNSFSAEPLVRAENASSTIVNMRMYAYNNEIRN